MLLLLTDGSGLTSRQVATQASAAGHRVEVVTPGRVGLARFTRHVRRVHHVPAYGRDPYGWLEATLAVLRSGGHDVLMPTQEQAAILAREAGAVRELGVALAVPPFASLARVQDKLAQARTLRELGLPQPDASVARSARELLDRATPPVYLKVPIGTASAGVRRAGDGASLAAASRELSFADGGVLVQRALEGRLAMVQAIFDRGRLVAWHVNVREREGASGGASVKRSAWIPAVERHLDRLGGALTWHGALSLDAILTPGGPSYIDVNPRLVEPGNAWRAGVDLVDALLRVSCGEPVERLDTGRSDVRTHQLLLGVLGAAARGRRAVLRELLDAAARRGPYAGSTEELTPARRDPLAAVPVAAATAATLAAPRSRRLFTDGAVSGYALTPAAWREIVASAQA